MVKFLIKGLLRDKHRSLFPVLIVASGVTLTVLIQCWISGILGEIVDTSAAFATGHVKIMSRAYAENAGQNPGACQRRINASQTPSGKSRRGDRSGVGHRVRLCTALR